MAKKIKDIQDTILDDYEKKVLKQEAEDKEKKVETRGRKSTQYMSNDMLVFELSKMKETGIISEELGKAFITLVRKIGGHSNFRFYPEYIKSELESAALLRLCKFCDRVDLERENINAFSYLTTIVINAMIYELKQHYKEINIKKAIAEKYIQEMQEYAEFDESSSYIAQRMRENIQNGF
jgi:hypothetical protein